MANALKGDTSGGEIAPDWKPAQWLEVKGSYSYLHLYVHDEVGFTDTSNIATDNGSSPHHQVVLEGRFNIPKGIKFDPTNEMVRRCNPPLGGGCKQWFQRRIIDMQIRSVGIDLGKTTFHLVALGTSGKVLVKKKFTQKQLLAFTANMQTSLIGLEACSGAHFLGGALRDQGHDVRLIAAQFVKPFVKSNKNDFVDAEAIAEAVERKNMRFVPIKTDERSRSASTTQRAGRRDGQQACTHRMGCALHRRRVSARSDLGRSGLVAL